jgi:site-specific recombinase XerD
MAPLSQWRATHMTILCPQCNQRFQEVQPPLTDEEFASIETDNTSTCPHCGAAIDLAQLNVFSLKSGPLYLEYTIYPDLLLTYLPPIDQNPVAVYLFSLGSERSRQVMTQALRTAASLLTGQDAQNADILAVRWGDLRHTHTSALRSHLSHLYSPATANRTLSALRSVLKEALRLEQISEADYQQAVDIRPIKQPATTAARVLAADEIRALLAACAADPIVGVRDAAMIGLLYTCGLRRAELVALDVDDFDATSGDLRLQAKQRTILVKAGALQAMQDYLTIRGRTTGPLFIPIMKGNRKIKRRMNPQSVYDLLRKRGQQANVPDFSLDDLRRTYLAQKKRLEFPY